MGVIYPEFVDNTQFIQMDDSVPEANQLRAMLNNLTRVHQLTARKFDSLDDLIHEYLACGCEIFGLETGIVSQISAAGTYLVLDVQSPLEVLEQGQEFDLSDTYCREVVKTESVIGFPEVGRLDYMNSHPVYTNLKLEAYLSAPIYVDSTLFGTLNYTSTKPRPHGFSKNEYNLILLMANSIGNYILLRNKNDRLEELNNQIIKFVGYVAHDLRNPIGGIYNLAQLAAADIDNKDQLAEMLPQMVEAAEDSLELINSILDMAALSTGRLTAEIEAVPIKQLINRAVDSVSSLIKQKEVSIELDVEESQQIYCDEKRMQQALTNLLINAIKYSPCNGKIKVECVPDGKRNLVSITNDKADKGTENVNAQGIYDSVGFGLDIVKTVLAVHDSELELLEEANQYQARFTLESV